MAKPCTAIISILITVGCLSTGFTFSKGSLADNTFALNSPALKTTTATGVSADKQEVLSLIREKGCGSCHQIPAMSSANGRVGPSLAHYSKRAYIAGVMPNTKENLIAWLLNPKAVTADTAMPNSQLTIAQAKQITTFLLRD